MGGSNVCNYQCTNYRISGPPPKGGRYLNGQKRCQMCEVYIKWDGIFCPCCGYMLRNKARGKSSINVIRI